MSKRKEELIKLLTSKNEIFSGEEICVALRVSSRTIRNDIKEINEMSKTGNIVKAFKGKGYKITISKDEAMILLGVKEEYNLDYRLEHILIKLLSGLLRDTEIKHEKLIEELYISLSLLKNDIKVLREKLEKHNLTIEKSSNKGIKIEGKEKDIRSLINMYLFSKEAKCKDVFIKDYIESYGGNIEKLEGIVREILDKRNMVLTDVGYWCLINHIVTTVIRKRLNKNIKFNKEEILEMMNKSEWNIGKEIVDKLDLDYIGLEEGLYISRYIGTGKIALTTPLEMKELVLKILLETKKVMGIDLLKDEVLKRFLGAHLKSSIKKARYNIADVNTMLMAIKNKYPLACSVGVLASEVVYKECGVKLDENSIGYLALHFEAAFERKKEIIEYKKVLLVCTTGLGTSLLLKVKLEKKFKDKLIVVDTIRRQELSKEMLKDIDFLISTVPIDIEEKEVIYLKNLLDEEEEVRIKKLIEPKGKGFEELLRKNTYFTDIKEIDKNKVLEEITKRLVENEYIDMKGKENIIKREELSSTDIGNLVAIPHTMEGIKTSFISMTILKKPINWGSDNVQLVIVIGIAKEERGFYKEGLEKFYKRIIELHTVLKIIKEDNFDDVKEYFR
ncbi:MAG: BglG family transcription antiterminator [Clostridium sp.]